MSKALDTLIDKYINMENLRVFKEDIAPEDTEAYIKAVKCQLKDQIYKEVCEEVREEALEEAEKITEKKARQKRIEEFRKLAVDGLIVAFFVGLLVNQSTDIIGYFKGSFITPNIGITVVIAVVIFLVCVGLCGFWFISEILRLIEGIEK